jgi:hypothetical protein
MTRRTMAIFSAALVLAACSDDTLEPTGDRLTRAEASIIANNVTANSEQTVAMPEAATVSSSVVAADPVDFTQELELNITCPAGGTLQQKWNVIATIDQDVGDFSLDVVGFQKHLACAYQHEGITITVDGDPDIDMKAHIATDNHRPSEHTLEIDGAFKWTASDGRSGTCPITLDAVTDFGARKRTVNGNVCGHTVTETTTWSN